MVKLKSFVSVSVTPDLRKKLKERLVFSSYDNYTDLIENLIKCYDER